MERGLWRYEANVAEPSHLNTACLALRLWGVGGIEGRSYYAIAQSNCKHNHKHKTLKSRVKLDDTVRSFVIICDHLLS